ncbi:aminotransferase class V-fold PLP-dependent enzyme [Pseudomonas typographi]|uniref:Aminotransferase class V-fold PLP-dependent enzyme n=1 Tax=Pseudomonas typographi TaxID=2715964 RepID=A0ABR7Z2W2_9PSED|nr:aminotransferase class V-fold PLP-dependent enzyme [Pseudomonas typographi]MBD1599815.1 aminotransferase class V-fold PLP-dependent enzyme [Pseudomonas typographi]
MQSLFNDSELLRFRADTPAYGRWAHFAHGSSSLPPFSVFEAQRRWLDAEERHGTFRSLHLFKDELAQTRQSVARLIGAQEHQIAFLDSTSRGWALALAAAYDGARPVEVITTEHEWGANAMNLLYARSQGRIASLHILYDQETPASAQTVERLSSANANANSLPVVALQAVNPIDGSITQTQGIAAAVQHRDGLLFIDASQAVGQLPVNVQDNGCDVLVFPARKWLRGPKGISVLYLSDRALAMLGAPPVLDIASAVWQSKQKCLPYPDARRFETYEFSPGTRLALKAACDYLLAVGPKRVAAHNQLIREKIAAALQSSPALQALPSARPSALMTFRIDESSANPLLKTLEAAGINANLITQQYARWALQARSHNVLLRLTPHYFTSDAEIERLLQVLSGWPASLFVNNG